MNPYTFDLIVQWSGLLSAFGLCLVVYGVKS